MDIAAAIIRIAAVVIAVCCGNGGDAVAQVLLMPEAPMSVTAPDADMLSELFPELEQSAWTGTTATFPVGR